MAAIAQHDYEAMFTCIARLHGCDDVEQFPLVALTEIPKLVGADHATFNYVAPSVPKVVVLGQPDLTGNQHAERERVFAQYLSDQPILKNYLATGNPEAHKLSDFLSVREYHRLPLYQRLYHDLRYEDQMAFLLFPPGSEMIAIALARQKRNFTERDRDVLNRLRPHVAQAYQRARKFTLLHRALRFEEQTAPEVRVTTILLDEINRPIQFGPEARLWLERFFPAALRNALHLPEPVEAWLRRSGSLRDGAPSPCRCDALVRERAGQWLRLNLFPSLARKSRTLVLELETTSHAAHAALNGRLTRREIEVLHQVEQGKTNEETAAALGISPLTVRTHLEHIFGKLRVPSRTAAVTHFRRLCERVTLGISGMIATLDGWFPAVSVVTI